MLQLRLALCTIAVLLITSTCTASRTILVATSQANGAPKQPAAPQQIFQQQGLAAGQTWQPLQQLQQQIQQQQQNLNSSNHSSNATSLPPSSRFVTVNPHQRPPQFQQAEEQLKQQQQRQQQQQSSITAESFECGRPFMPCGSAIPAGKTCSQGPGWCQPGYHCGYEVTTAEPSKCLPLPENCGKAGHACCPSNADIPHASLQDKLDRKPFCTDGSYCFFHAPEPGLDNGDVFAGNKGTCGSIVAMVGSSRSYIAW